MDTDTIMFTQYDFEGGTVHTKPAEDSEYDLITFLAVVQKVQLDILPLVWQSARVEIGRGASATVYESSFKNFAFKCVLWEANSFRALINEVIVLSQLRAHLNIIELQGICWRITEYHEVWPVLVFEKAPFGDLYDFLKRPDGRNLSFSDRLSLCADIGNAIIDMHSYGIIHGDIKPNNVVLFRNKSSAARFTAKVIDFGHSTRFVNEDECIMMPKSIPWTAPEHHFRCQPAQALRMEVFSFGMLCLWVLFEEDLSAKKLLPLGALGAEPYLQKKGEKDRSIIVLEEWKNDDKLAFLAQQFVATEQDLDDSKKVALQEFFGATLQCRPDERAADLKQAIGFLAPDPARPSTSKSKEDSFNALECCFEILPSIDSFYRSDYQVRSYIHHCLELKISVATTQRTSFDLNLPFQLALCYSIGFGVARSDTQTQENLLKSGRSQEELDEAIISVHRWNTQPKELRGAVHMNLQQLCYAQATDLTNEYRKSGKLDDAKAKIKQEIRNAGWHAAEDSRIITILIDSLSFLFVGQGLWDQAEELEVQAMETRKRVLGTEHPDTLISMTNLASTYRNQGRLIQAEQLEAQVVETYERVLGAEHPVTLVNISQLALVLSAQGKYDKAEEMSRQVLKVLEKKMGEQHPDTLTSVSNLALVLQDQKKYDEAETMSRRVLKVLEMTMGEQHPDTLTSVSNLAMVLQGQKKYDQAEKMHQRAIEGREKTLGKEHPASLHSIHRLAVLLHQLKRYGMASELYQRACDGFRKTLGPDHPETIECLNDYSAIQLDETPLIPVADVQVNLVPTDSGYASMTHRKSNPILDASQSGTENMAEALSLSDVDPAVKVEHSVNQEQVMPKFGLYSAPTTYSASETSSLPLPRNKEYISQLALDLFNSIKSYESDRNTLKRISGKLPDLLRAFALKIGHKAQSQMHRDISFFVHKHRKRIQALFEHMFPLEDVGPPEFDRIRTGEFSIERFLEEPMLEIQHDPEPDIQEDIESDVQDDVESNLINQKVDEHNDTSQDHMETALDSSPYRDFILETPAYKWLVASLQGEATLAVGTPDLMETIRQTIFSAFPSSQNVSRKESSKAYKVTFELDWDPLDFVREQQYTESPKQALERAITLTGCPNNAQALTTMAYLCQTWPTTGKQVMRLVKDVIRIPKGHIDNVENRPFVQDFNSDSLVTLPDGTEVNAWISGNETPGRKFIVTAIGTPDSIAEIGQQFAWLGAALRSSPFESGVAVCSPLVRNTYLGNTAIQAQTSDLPRPIEMFCNIGFEISDPVIGGEAWPGQCWHSMFRNPVIVKGYPILTKQVKEMGLEMPLNMIARLTGTERANEFDSKVFIKGFSAMLIAIRITNDLLIWHYLYNRTGEKISYLDHSFQVSDDISLLQLAASRHVVGWCWESMYYAGAKDAQYNIRGTGLPPPHAGCLLEKVAISGGKWLSAGATIAIGMKDIPPHLPRNGYFMNLKWLETKYAVIWDDAYKKGWLVNGTSALLHLVRAWLEFSSKDNFASRFLFDPSKMNNSDDHTPNSAIGILTNEENMKLAIYPGKNEGFEEEETKQQGDEIEESKTLKRKKGYFLFGDLVEQYYNILAQILEHQEHVAGQNGKKIKVRVRKHLEGWDFFDLATGRDPRPRITTLHSLGYGWVDLIRSIEAVTLMGRGFGDIIRPIRYDRMCPKWNSLPPNMYYLAASVYDLKNIITSFGNEWASPPEMVHGLVWHCPGDIVAPCRCQSSGFQKKIFKRHHDPVQVFFPRSWHPYLRLGGPDKLADTGAVVFGHNVEWKYRWKENGNEDLEEWCDDSLRVPSDEDQAINEPISFISGSSTRADNLSATSRRSRSHESSNDTAATSLYTDSNDGPAQAPTAVKPVSSNSRIDLPAQEEMPDPNKPRKLRREKRRL